MALIPTRRTALGWKGGLQSLSRVSMLGCYFEIGLGPYSRIEKG